MKLTTRLELTSDWHIGSGSGSPGGADRTLRRRADGLPFVPAKTVTGLMRSHAETIAEGLGGSWPDICRFLFGERGGANAKVSFRPLSLSPETIECLRSQPLLREYFGFNRVSVKIDDQGLAEDKKLFVTELGRKGLVFTGDAQVNHDVGPHALTLLALASRRTTRLGGGRRRGRGRCKLVLSPENSSSTSLLPEIALLSDSNPPVPHLEVTRRDGPDLPPASLDKTSLVDVDVSIVLDEPVVALERTNGNTRTSHTYIPGTLLLGPLVARAGGWTDLRPLVFTGHVSVRNAYPALGGSRLLPAPHALFVPKRGRQGEALVNALVGVPPPGTKPLRGKYIDPGEGAPTLVHTQDLSHFTHAVVDKNLQRPTAKVGGVYTYRAIPRGTELRTVMTLPRSNAEQLSDAEFQLAVGASKKDDYGAATAKFLPETIRTHETTTRSPTSTITIWFLSDAIVLDGTLQPAPTVDGVKGLLERSLGTSMGLEADQSYLRAVRREGWGAGSNLPRSTMPCIAAGSVVRFKITGDAPCADELAAFEARGLGERIAEGFGEIAVDPSLLAIETLDPTRPGRESPPADRSTAPVPDELLLLVSAATEEATRRIAGSLAPSVSTYLGLGSTRGKDAALSKTQLGSLREAAGQWRRDAAALDRWIHSIESNPSRKNRWGPTLEHLRSFEVKWPDSLDNSEAALAGPILDLVALDRSGTARRQVAARILATAVQHALVGTEGGSHG